MRLQLIIVTSLALAVPAQAIRADAPLCVLFGPTVPAGGYTGSAAPAGTPGNVLDRCGTMPGGAVYDLSNRHEVKDWIDLADAQVGFDLWVGAPAEVSFVFFLDGVRQYKSGTLHLNPKVNGWWGWDGKWDRLLIYGAHAVTVTWLDPPLPGDDPPIDDGLQRQFAGIAPEGTTLTGDDLSVVPEPATLTLLGTGLVGLAGASRRRRRREQLD